MYSEAKTNSMQNVSANVGSVTTNVSRNKFNNATQRCQQFNLHVALRSANADTNSGRIRGVLTNLWCKNKSLATPTTGIVKILSNVCATSAHTRHAKNFPCTLHNFDLQFLLWSRSVLKIRVSVVRFRDWPPVLLRTPCLTARRFVLCVCKRATTLQQRCFNFALTLFYFARCV